MGEDGKITREVYTNPRILVLPVPHDIAEVPQAPDARLPSLDTLNDAERRIIRGAKSLLQERPVFTRRALRNSLPGNDWDTVGYSSTRLVFQYCGYSFSSGPWRDCTIRYGVDPRKDVECRKYQSLLFMLENEPQDNRGKYIRKKNTYPNPPKSKTSHLFDGESVKLDGKVWQVCDITEPFLHNLLATDHLREECHVSLS